jgi:molybdopterin adenylyltransferase
MGPPRDVERIFEFITPFAARPAAERRALQCRRMAVRSDLEHKAAAPHSVGCYVITVSDTRTEDTDTGGRAIVELLTAAGHRVAGRTIIKDDTEQVRDTIERQLANPDVQVIITTGGTGISSRDTTFEAVCGLLWKRLDGFGELFRMLSYQQIGAAAMMSRAVAGLIAGRIVVALPGSEAAVRLALEKLLIPELGHLVREASR